MKIDGTPVYLHLLQTEEVQLVVNLPTYFQRERVAGVVSK